MADDTVERPGEEETAEDLESRIKDETKAERKKRFKEAWLEMMNTAQGRAVVFDIMAMYLGGERGVWTAGMQPHDVIGFAAIQSTGANLRANLRANYPEQFKLMLQENG